MEVILAVSLGILLLVGVSSAFSSYRTQANYNRAKMMLSTARSNITMYRYRKGQFPPITCDTATNANCSSLCTNKDDQGNAFFSSTDLGKVPIDPVKNTASLNDVAITATTSCTAASPVSPPAGSPVTEGGWLYNQTTGVLQINLRNDAKYGLTEEQPSTW